jgi:hypothetical protein
MSNDIVALFNGRPIVQLVQGEDMAIAVSLRSRITQLPFDLTGCGFEIGFVSVDDRVIVRSTEPTMVAISGTVAQGDTVTAYAHGLTSGDLVLVAGSGAPTPLVAGDSYEITVMDADTFYVLDNTTHLPISFTALAMSAWSVSTAGITLSSPLTSGVVSVVLPANFTANIKAGVGQTFQIETKNSGLVHVYLQDNELDVFAQI